MATGWTEEKVKRVKDSSYEMEESEWRKESSETLREDERGPELYLLVPSSCSATFVFKNILVIRILIEDPATYEHLPNCTRRSYKRSPKHDRCIYCATYHEESQHVAIGQSIPVLKLSRIFLQVFEESWRIYQARPNKVKQEQKQEKNEEQTFSTFGETKITHEWLNLVNVENVLALSSSCRNRTRETGKYAGVGHGAVENDVTFRTESRKTILRELGVVKNMFSLKLFSARERKKFISVVTLKIERRVEIVTPYNS
ncbi:hypothetical protein WN51_03390 [Melipona quadrifasciata]|uniref:Uncharacterized protein n=1 Tax=Melipona quadrifasciata TaxID=166423 RepID=A0A0N0BDU6_9HYME|nr:hypothetical protein WN51_03390 [Melipona quadrifasciata]